MKERNMRLEMQQVRPKRRRDTTIIPFENVRASFMDDGKLSHEGGMPIDRPAAGTAKESEETSKKRQQMRCANMEETSNVAKP